MSVSPSNDTGINNILSFIGTSNSQVQLIVVVGLFIILMIASGYLFNRRRK